LLPLYIRCIHIILGKRQKIKDFEKNFNTILENKVNNSIITYLKIRNDQHNNIRFNQKRFPYITYDSACTKILVKYNPDDISYHDVLIKNKPTEIQDKKNIKSYLFGEFTKIYLPEKKNKEIAQDMQNIINKLVQGNPLFMLGYGASGAGKTSALIYHKNAEYEKDKPGVIIHLCDLMAEKGYTEIELQYSEYYYKKKLDTKYESKDKKYEEKTIINDGQTNTNIYPLKFNFDDTKKQFFLVSESYTHNIMHPYRFKNMNEKFTEGVTYRKEIKDFDTKKFEGKKKVVEKSTNTSKIATTQTDTEHPNLGEIIINLVDTDRLVKATTNNPNSSRSHTLVFLKLKKGDEEANIIVGDFAGVENEFDCANPEVLNKFLNRKREDKDSTKNNTLFYSNNADVDNNILDPIDTNDSIDDPNKKTMINAINKKNDPVYDFDKIIDPGNNERNNDFINEITKFDYYKGIGIDFMRKYIPFVRKYVGALVFNDSKYEPKRWIEDKETTDIGTQKIEQAYNSNNIKDALQKLLNVFKLVNEKDFLKIYIIGYDPQLKIKLTNKLDKKNREYENLQTQITDLEETIKNDKEIKNIDDCKEKIINKLSITSDGTVLYNDIKNYDKGMQLNFLTITKKWGFIEGTTFIERFSYYIIDYLKKVNLVNILKEILKLDPKIPHNIDNMKNLISDEITYSNKGYNFEGFLKKFDELKEKKINILRSNTAFSTIYELKKDINDINIQIKEINDIDKLENELKEMKMKDYIKNNNNSEADSIFRQYYNKIREMLGLNESPDILKCLNINYTSLTELAKNLQKQTELRLLIDDNIDDNSTLLTKLLDFTKKMELENFNRQQGIKEICENRLIEGKFINSSLFEVRNTIKQILYKKNNGENISPKFIDECFAQYCPNREYCFTSKEEEEKRIEKATELQQPTPSERKFTDIFGKIFDILNGTNIKPIPNPKYKTITEMYEKIIVSVFCVFNISEGANDPPPVPYIDINELKYIYNFKINDQTNLKIYLKKAVEDIIKYELKTKDLREVVIANNKNLNDKIKNMKIIDAIQHMINNEKEYLIKSDTNKTDNFFGNMIIIVQEFIDMIDKNNAISAIGTLEFLDQLAKFNKVSNICRADFNIANNKAIELPNMISLYNKSDESIEKVKSTGGDNINQNIQVTNKQLVSETVGLKPRNQEK